MKPGAGIRDVIIIGAGASGLFCARECAKRGRSVLVLDHAARTQSKVRISGGGRCNFTNLQASADHYRSENPHFCRSALARFSPRDILSLLEQHHTAYAEKEAGQYFCAASSRQLVELLDRECSRAGVEVLLGCSIEGVSREDGFVVRTSRGDFRASSLVIATGGLSYPRLGATGLGHKIARQFGLALTATRPALVPFVLPERERQFCRSLAGVSLEAAFACSGRRYQGSLLFTHRGLSGPVALQASLFWEPGTELAIDLLPGVDLAAIFRERRQSRVELRNLLATMLPKRLSQAWCEQHRIMKPLDQTSDRELERISAGLHGWTIVPTGTEGYDVAEVTAGGVSTGELSSKTMESRKVKGLYFIGEVVDVTGELGGYNLHWAWASGYAAGQVA